MSMRTTLVAVLALGAGLLTVRTLRRRRREAAEPDPREAARSEATEATEHATAALSHARTAGGHAVEYARGEMDTDADDSTNERPSKRSRERLVQRLR